MGYVSDGWVTGVLEVVDLYMGLRTGCAWLIGKAAKAEKAYGFMYFYVFSTSKVNDFGRIRFLRQNVFAFDIRAFFLIDYRREEYLDTVCFTNRIIIE